MDNGVRGRLKSIIPQGDIGNSKRSYKSSFHSVSFTIIWYLLLFAFFGRVVIKHQKGGDCKENGPFAHLVCILVFDGQHDQVGLMNLQVFVLLSNRVQM